MSACMISCLCIENSEACKLNGMGSGVMHYADTSLALTLAWVTILTKAKD